jgi:hypothetical protein
LFSTEPDPRFEIELTRFGISALVALILVPAILGEPIVAWWLTTDMRTAAQAKRWPVTEGQIVSSDIKTCGQCDGPKFSVHVSYTYQVAGDGFTGTKLLFGSQSFDTEREAQASRNTPAARRYPSITGLQIRGKASSNPVSRWRSGM